MPTLLPPFSIDQPTSLDEASSLLLEYGEEGRTYAGGTELLLAMKHAGLAYGHLVDIKTIPGLDGITIGHPERRAKGPLTAGGDASFAAQHDQEAIRIGALATHLAIERSPLIRTRLPALAELEANVANPRVRASGTLGGNLCFAEPHSDPAALLLCLDARVQLSGPEGKRELPLAEFIAGPYDVALGEGELLEAILIAAPAPGQRAHYRKVQLHERPMLGLALVATVEDHSLADARVAVGSASPIPLRSAAAESLLSGSIDVVRRQADDAAEALASEAELLDDLEGGVEYKRHLIHVELKRALEAILNV